MKLFYKKKLMSKIIALIIVVCTALLNPMMVFAIESEDVTVEQIKEFLGGMQNMVDSLEELGFSLTDICDLMTLSGEADSEIIETLKFEIDNYNQYQTMLYDYDGNPPKSQSEQNDRFLNVFSVAMNNKKYHRNYYEGNLRESEEYKKNDFGDYISYLYISHYIDGPECAPTENDLPYIISESDIGAYNKFISVTDVAPLISSISDFSSYIYTKYDYMKTVNSRVENLNSIIDDKKLMVYSVYLGCNDIKNISGHLISLTMESAKNVYYYGISEDEFYNDVNNYVNDKLSSLGYYEEFGEEIVSKIKDIFISIACSVILDSLSLFAVYMAAIPLFVYSFSSLIDVAALVNLGYTFSARYAIRTGIYLDI